MGSLEYITDTDKKEYRVCPRGILNENYVDEFSQGLERFYSEHPGEKLIIDCTGLEYMTNAGIAVLKHFADAGRQFTLENLNQDSYVAMFSAGMDKYCGTHSHIPVIDLSQYTKIGEGSNGVVYSIGDEQIVKAFKKNPDFDTMMKERVVTKRAFKLGIECPISFGFVIADGKIALLEEMVKSKSYTKLARKDPANIKKYINAYTILIKRLHSICGDALRPFPRQTMLKELLAKADRVDAFISEPHKGRLREIIESIDAPEVLIHGDIQPNNIRISDNGAGFIDLETLSTGPAILDLGGLRRTLFSELEFVRDDYNEFLEMPADMVREIWKAFTEGYFKGMPEEAVRKELYLAEVIGDILSAAKYIKKDPQSDPSQKAIRRLEQLIDEWDNYKK